MGKMYHFAILVMGLLFFLSCTNHSGKNDSFVYKDLSNELKDKYRLELQRDTTNDFDSDFKRTTDLERRLIDEFGFAAIQLIFEGRNSHNYYEAGKFPTDCPWGDLNSKSTPEIIEYNFAPLKDKLTRLITSLKERCQFIYAERKDDGWNLHYLLKMKLNDGRDYYIVYTGGMPNQKPVANKSLEQYGWTIPADLVAFYKVHDGFGEVYDANYILRSTEISVMAQMMDSICKKQKIYPDGYTFDDLLEFFPDGAGNAQCFYRDKKKNANNGTFDWDHEVWEISGPVVFFEFIDERMSEIDEE